MSSRNLFVINNISENDRNNLITFEEEMINFARVNNFGVYFNPIGYQDEVINELNINGFYFCISESFNIIESEDLFSTNDSFNYIKEMKFKRKKAEDEEKNFLLRKFSFLDEIILMIDKYFMSSNMDFYISDQYSFTLLDYKTIEVREKKLTQSFVDSFMSHKKEKYVGLKTHRFKIK